MTSKHAKSECFATLMRALSMGHSLADAAQIAGLTLRTAQRWRSNGGPPAGAGRAADPDRIRRVRLAERTARRTIVRDGRRHPRFSSAPRVAAQLAVEFGVHVSGSTVLRYLTSRGWKTRVRPRHPNLSNPALRLRFARAWTRKNEWHRLVFSDEHFVSINDNSLRTMLVPPGTQPIPREHQRRQNVPNFQIWAAIGVGWRSPLVIFPKVNADDDRAQPGGFRLNGQSYVRRCLSRVSGYLGEYDVVFMQDGARCHWAANVRAYLAGRNIEVMEGFPSSSPDLNPIESLWGVLDRRIAERHPRTHDELRAVALEEWDAIPQSTIDNLVLSFEGKCRKVVKNGGI